MHAELITSGRAAQLAGCSFRQVDHWARQGVIVPALDAIGSGARRGYSYDDVVALRLVTVLRNGGGGGLPNEWLRDIVRRVGRPVPAEGIVAVTGHHVALVPSLDEVVLHDDVATTIVSLAGVHAAVREAAS